MMAILASEVHWNLECPQRALGLRSNLDICLRALPPASAMSKQHERWLLTQIGMFV